MGQYFASLSGLEPNYMIVLQEVNNSLGQDLSHFEEKIPHLQVIRESIPSASTVESLTTIHDQLQTCYDILAAKKPLKIKSSLKRLKELRSPELTSQISDFLSGYFLERAEPLTSYNHHILEQSGLKRLTEVAKLLPSEENPTATPLPKSISLREYAAADHRRTYPVALQRCLKFCGTPALAGKLLGSVIVRRQADGIGNFKDLTARETLELLAKKKGPDYSITTQVDFRGYSSHVVEEVSEEDDEFEGGIEIDEEELGELFPGEDFQALLRQFKSDKNGGLLITSAQALELYKLWTSRDQSLKILTNPLNILHACIGHPDKNSNFCDKYTLLLSLWLNSHFPGSVSLRPVPQIADLLDILEEQIESIENILESFSFYFDIKDLPAEYLVIFRLDELILNQEQLGPLLPTAVKQMMAAIIGHPSLVHKTEAFGIILERTVTAGHLQAELTGDEAKLLHEYMDIFGFSDSRFSEEFHRQQGSANIYNFEESSSNFLAKFVIQVKKLIQDHKSAEFEVMEPVEVLSCMQFIQTIDGGAHLMQFIAKRLANSEKYGELFCEILSKSRSIPDAINRYTVYLNDVINDGHRPAALVMLLFESDHQLKDLIWEREEYMSAEEILDYLETMHPFKVEAVCSQFYFDMDFERLQYPRNTRKSQTLSQL